MGLTSAINIDSTNRFQGLFFRSWVVVIKAVSQRPWEGDTHGFTESSSVNEPLVFKYIQIPKC